jgi:hypothetical protein
MMPMIFVLAWYTLPLVAYVVARYFREPVLHFLVIGLTMVAGYLLVIGTVIAGDAHDRARIETFDLNRDGRIDDSERTEEADREISDQGKDTGRALAPVLGIPLTVVWYSFLFGVLYGGEWLIKKLFSSSPVASNGMVRPDHGGE